MWFDSSSNGEDTSENPMRVVEEEKLVLSARVRESVDRKVRAEQVEKNEDSDTQKKSRELGRKRQRKFPDDDDVISTWQKAIEDFRGKDNQRGDRFREHNMLNIQTTIEKIEKIVEVHRLRFSNQVVDVRLSRNDKCL